MASAKMKRIRLLACFFVLLFAGLLAIRMDLTKFLFSDKTRPKGLSPTGLPETETWMNLFLKGKKIGYSHCLLSKKKNGYRLNETLFIRLNIMGFPQDLKMTTTADLKPDLIISSFDFRMDSGIFRFTATGRMKTDTTLAVETSLPGAMGKKEITLDHPPYITAGLLYAAFQKLKTGGNSRFIFHIFDPATMSQEPVTVSAAGREEIINQGERIKTTKLKIHYKGIDQTAWMDENGEIIREKGILGMTLEKTTKKNAYAGISANGGRDLTRLASVPADAAIASPRRAGRLKIRLGGISCKNLNLDGGRQTLSGNVLTITKEAIPTGASPDLKAVSQKMKKFLAPEPFIESDDPQVKRLASSLVSADDTPLQKAQKLVKWVFKNIKKQPVLSLPDAVVTLKNRVGDCNEHAVLLAALARAAGIPAKVEAGLVYLNGRFYYHAWNLLYVKGWITADAVFGQMPADATHIRFVSGSPKAQLDLIPVIDKVKINILETDASGRIKGSL